VICGAVVCLPLSDWGSRTSSGEEARSSYQRWMEWRSVVALSWRPVGVCCSVA
jgi:hypothetical protein